MLKKFRSSTKITLLLLMLVSLTAFVPFQQTEEGNESITARITQVDTSQFPKVTVYISVTDENGEPVAVSVSRLVIYENGKEMEPEEIGGVGEIGPLTTMLVMDVSGSMNHAGKLLAAKDAARTYISQNRPQDDVGLIAFNTEIDYVQPLTSNRQKLEDAIENLNAKDDTALYDALAQAIAFMEAGSGRKAIIALTDGLDNRSKITPQEVIQMIGPEGLSISTIGLGEPTHSKSALSGLDEPALTALSELAGGVYGYANDAESLRKLYELYGRSLQSEYAITYTSPAKLRDGVNRSLSVEIKEPGEGGVSGEEGTSVYNPGGLVPEVAEPASWTVFAALLVGLLLLLIIPMLIVFAVRFVRSRRGGKVKVKGSNPKKSRVKIKG